MGWCPGGDKLDQEIFDAMAEFIASMMQRGEQLAQRLGVPIPAIKALHRIDGPVAMKDLGQQMHCDPSFVTMIADVLEKRGLARREPNATDRRVKNLVLTDRGLEIKAAVQKAALGEMPWTRALDRAEREQFLELLRKMCSSLAADSTESTAAPEPETEVSSETLLTQPVAG